MQAELSVRSAGKISCMGCFALARIHEENDHDRLPAACPCLARTWIFK